MSAVALFQPQTCTALVQFGADVRARDIRARTPLALLVECFHYKWTELEKERDTIGPRRDVAWNKAHKKKMKDLLDRKNAIDEILVAQGGGGQLTGSEMARRYR